MTLSLAVLPASAATTPATPAPAGQGLEISPPLINKSVDPGAAATFDIRLRNVTTQTLATTGTVDDFVAQNETGQPKLLIGDSGQPSPYTFKSWVASIPGMTLAPQEQKTVTVTLNVPKDASPGGHYGVIRFTAQPVSGSGSNVSLSASIGTLVLLNVSGKVVTKASIAELYAMQNGKKANFFEKGPLVIGVRIKNEGNVHFQPSGTVRVTNMLSRETAVLSVNPLGGNVLPQSVRKFEMLLNKKNLFGHYNAQATIQYSGQTINQTIGFWVIPYKLIAIILGILILLVVGLRFAIKRYNRYIINKAKKQQ
jgi:hypothetical protein